MLLAKDDLVLMSGAAGTGKSVPALLKLHTICSKVPGARCLLVRKTLTSLTSSTLVSFRERVAKEAIRARQVQWYGGSQAEPAAYKYPGTGAVLVVGGLDKPTKLLSTEYDVVFLDEAVEATADDVDTILSRLRNGKLPYQQLIMATNPGAPTHPLKQRADAGGLRMLYSKHEDNPWLYSQGEWTADGQSYLARLDKLTGHRYQRLRLGKWTSAEGIVYTDYDPATHLLDRSLQVGGEEQFRIPDSWTRYWAVDFGYTNPFVWQHWATDPDGRLYLVDEIYQTKTIVEDHAKAILKIVAPGGVWKVPKPRAVICDHDAEDRATLERHLGLGTVAAHKTVSDGIQAVQARFRPAGDGRPRLYFLRDAVARRDPERVDAGRPACTAEEIDGYVWETSADGKPDKDRPVKVDDHGMDAMRYIVAELDLAPRPRVRFF
jgi:phage terminase large subunit